MNVTIQDQKKLAHLEREEIRAVAKYEGTTPSRNEFRKEVAKAAKAKPEQVVVRRITPDFGTTSAVIEASIYDNIEALENIEPKYMKARHGKEPAKEESAEEEESPEEKAPEKKEEASEKEAPAKESKEESKESGDDKKEEKGE